MNTTSRRSALFLGTAAFALATSVAFAGPASAATADPDSSASLADVENSLLHVYTTYSGFVEYPTADGWVWSDRVTVGFSCTGWFASDQGHVATAGHCVDPEDGREAILSEFLEQMDAEEFFSEAMSYWLVEGYEPGSGYDHIIEVVQAGGADDPIIDTWTIAELIDFQSFERGDAALLKVAGVTGTVPLTIAADSPQIGEDVVAIGFPGSVQDVVDVQRLGASFKTGTVSSHQVTDSGVPVIEINAQVSPGMSGGPTIDDAGNVVGINSFMIRGEAQSFNFVTDTEGLATFLTRNGVTPTLAQASTDEGVTEQGDVDPDGATDEGEATTVPTSAEGRGIPASGDSAMGALIVGGLVGVSVLTAAGVAIAVIVVVRSRSSRRAAGHAEPTPIADQTPVTAYGQVAGYGPVPAPAAPSLT